LASLQIQGRCRKSPNEVLSGGWLQVYQLPERAGSGSVTLTVSNLEEVVAKLENMGVDTGERSSSEKLEILMITDPDGNHLALVEPIDPNLAQ
jgi:hypothetical protein